MSESLNATHESQSTWKRRRILLLGGVVGLLFVALLIGGYFWYSYFFSPESYLQDFYTYGDDEVVVEGMFMDPLILGGRKVIPLVLEKVRDKNMPRRFYAIQFLGNGEYKEALPVLTEILQDRTEDATIRRAALASIYKIDRALGVSYARQNESESGVVGKTAADILRGAEFLNDRRTFDEARSRAKPGD